MAICENLPHQGIDVKVQVKVMFFEQNKMSVQGHTICKDLRRNFVHSRYFSLNCSGLDVFGRNGKCRLRPICFVVIVFGLKIEDNIRSTKAKNEITSLESSKMNYSKTKAQRKTIMRKLKKYIKLQSVYIKFVKKFLNTVQVPTGIRNSALIKFPEQATPRREVSQALINVPTAQRTYHEVIDVVIFSAGHGWVIFTQIPLHWLPRNLT